MAIFTQLAVRHIDCNRELIRGPNKMLARNSRVFRILLVALLCLGLFTTGVARACLGEEHCMCCKSRHLQYTKEVSERHMCHTGGATACNFRKICDLLSFLGCDDSEDSSDPAVTTGILSNHLLILNNHRFINSAPAPCDRATSKASAIHQKNLPLLC